MTQDQFDLLNTALTDIRLLNQALISKNIGVLTEIKIQLSGSRDETTVKISSMRSDEDSICS
jgi:hypothetical protein